MTPRSAQQKIAEEILANADRPEYRDRPGIAELRARFSNLPDERDIKRQQGQVRRAFKGAAAQLLAAGWFIKGGRLFLHGRDGNWGFITLGTGPWEIPIRCDLYAGICSSYLMRVLDLGDPEQPPRTDFAVARSVAADQQFVYGEAVAPTYRSPRYEIRRFGDLDRPDIRLSPETVRPWLADALTTLGAAVEAGSGDLALRDDMLRRADASNDGALRWAALLTRHLGLDDEVPAILERARLARERLFADSAASGNPQKDSDRSKHEALWSHPRFVRFLENCPR